MFPSRFGQRQPATVSKGLTSGPSGTASQKALVNSLIAPSVGVPVDQMSDVATMLLAPAMAGTEVSVG